MKKPFAFSACCLMLLSVLLCFLPSVSAGNGEINNADLMPKYVPHDRVALEKSVDGVMTSPEWVKSLIIVEINVAEASSDGTFGGMSPVLEHLQEMGVNGIWLTPINDGGHYANYGPHTVNKKLTGKNDYEEGWAVVKQFIDQAHERNIRVFFDIITWGSHKFAPMYAEHPGWYGSKEEFGGWTFDWSNTEFRSFFLEAMQDMILKTGGDGFRCDCGVGYTSYGFFQMVREALYEKGHKVAFFSESTTDRMGVFDFDEHPVDGEEETWKTADIFLRNNLVDSTKTGENLDTITTQFAKTSGQHRFYSFLLSCHDSKDYAAKGNLVSIGYQAILSPYLPIWFLGEEWNNTYTSAGSWLYATDIDWSLKESNKEYFESVKKLIRIRRLYPKIFDYFPDNHRESNICKVETDKAHELQAYARYSGDKGILVLPNNEGGANRFQVTIPYADMGLSGYEQFELTDLLTGRQVAAGSAAKLAAFTAEIPYTSIGVYLITGSNACVGTDNLMPRGLSPTLFVCLIGGGILAAGVLTVVILTALKVIRF